MPSDPITADPELSELALQRELVSEFRLAASARAQEISRLLQTVDELTDRVRTLERALSESESRELAARSIGESREIRWLRALARRRSVRLVLRFDALIGRYDGGRRRKNAVR